MHLYYLYLEFTTLHLLPQILDTLTHTAWFVKGGQAEGNGA